MHSNEATQGLEGEIMDAEREDELESMQALEDRRNAFTISNQPKTQQEIDRNLEQILHLQKMLAAVQSRASISEALTNANNTVLHMVNALSLMSMPTTQQSPAITGPSPSGTINLDDMARLMTQAQNSMATLNIACPSSGSAGNFSDTLHNATEVAQNMPNETPQARRKERHKEGQGPTLSSEMR